MSRNSGECLDVYGASPEAAAPVIQLDVEYASTDDGARVIQYTPHGGANQQWLLRPVASPAAPVTAFNER